LFCQANHQTRAFFDGVQPVFADAPDDEGVIAAQIFIGPADGLHHVVPLIHVAFDGMHAGLAIIL